MDNYDYGEYEKILKIFLQAMCRDPECLVIGENISDTPEIKIIFESYGYNEETNEQDDKNMECYAIFIHKDSAQEDFQFPEHETSPWCLIHRPDEEVCIFAWYDVEGDDWSINGLEDSSEHKMTNQEVVEVLKTLYKKYCG